MKALLNRLFDRKPLSRAEAHAAMDEMLQGEAKPEQVAAFLSALHMRGETVEELAGFLESLRKKSVKVPTKSPTLFDIVGTGGDGAQTFNISTAASFVIAAAGVKVAKHGNRSVSSRCGSADVLEALGVNISTSPEVTAVAIDSGLGFLFAPQYHPALGKVGPVRRAMEVRTVFNLLGPLANPAGVKHQVVGVFSAKLIETFAELLKDAGVEQAMVVASDDGLDEISLGAPTSIAHLKAGKITVSKVTPETFGLKPSAKQDLQGGDAAANAKLIVSILEGAEKGPKRDVVVMNAAAGLVVTGKTKDFKEGAALAAKLIDDKSARNALSVLKEKQA